MKGKILYSLVIIVTLSCASTLHAQPSTDSACTTAISQIINRTYPNETALVLNSGRGPRDLGNYDECQATQGAHYCLLSVRNHDVVLLLTGLCAPSVCSGPELTTSAFALLAALNISIPADDIAAIRCVTKSDVQPVTTGGTVVLSFIGFLVLLAIIGTTIEYVRMRLVSSANSDCSELNETNDFAEPGLAASEKESLDENDPASINSAAPTPESESLLHHRRIPPPTTSWSSKIVAKLTEFLLAFSVISNATRLFAASPEKNLSSLNGIRVLSMLWIIVGHTVLFSSSLVLNIQYVMEHVIGSWLFMLIPGAEYSVDTFFYMSGFLVSYLTLKTLETKQRLNWALFYFHRVWRIIPPLAMMMLVYWKVAPLFGNGPFWVAFSASQQQCDSYWWATLLHIQNFYPDFESTCVGWTWYLANDMQFYIITPAILILYWKRPKLGLGLIGIMLIASFIASGVINVQEGYYARASGPGHAWTDKIYNKPYIRIPAYLVGVLFALLYLFVEKRRSSGRNTSNYGKLPFLIEMLIVLACVAVMSLLVFVTHDNYGPDAWAPSDVRSVLWNVFSRALWTICIGALVHLYATGHGLLFGSLLGAHVWTPLARLTYSAYLYHPVVMLSSYFSLKALIHYDPLTMSIYAIAFGVISYLVALASFLLIERPLVNLEKMLLPQHR